MATYMTYCRNLNFDETPNYAYLRRLFRELYNKCQFEHDYIFDWTIQRFRVEPPICSNDQNQLIDEEHLKNSSTIPDSLKNNLGAGSVDIVPVGSKGPQGTGDEMKLLLQGSVEEQWAKEQEDQIHNAELRNVEKSMP